MTGFFSKTVFAEIGKKWLLAGVTLLLAAALVPIYRLAMFATPFYDDFNYAYTVKIMYEATHSVSEVFKEALWVAKTTYLSWQGTYSSVFMMALMPAVFGFDKYFWGVALIITALVLSVVFFVYSVFTDIFEAQKTDALIAGELISLIVTELFHSAQQGIYWYNGGVHYTFAHAAMLTLLGLSLKFLKLQKTASKIVTTVVLSIFAVFVAGPNYVTALQGVLVLSLIIVYIFIKRGKTGFWTVPSAVFYLAGFILNATAPGNAARQSLYEGVAKSPAEAVLLSFGSAFMNLKGFTGLATVAAIIVLIPTFADIASYTKIKVKYPIPFVVLSFCLYATGFTPSWYGMGSEGLARTLCAVKITFLLLLFFDIFYLIAYLHTLSMGKESGKARHIVTGRYVMTYLAGVVILMLSFAMAKDKAGSFMTYGSYYYIHTGEAYNYKAEQLARDAFIRESGSEVELKPLVWRPWFLCKANELDSNPDMEQNQAAARWYGKSKIWVLEE